MRKLLVIGFIGLLLIAGLLVTQKNTAAQTTPTLTLPTAQVGPAGSTNPNLNSPDSLTSFKVSNPYCYQPDPSANQCSINFRLIQANDNQTSAPYLTWLAISISGKTRFSATAFFEGTITYTYDMVPNGLKVPCGAPNAGGAGNQYGLVYAVTITPLDTSRTAMSTDTANVTCPAYSP
jgi:ABC-type transport system substrate-binding protein